MKVPPSLAVSAGRFAGFGVVVTGGASGIGFAIAQRFLSEGAEVVLWDVSLKSVANALDLLSDTSTTIKGVVVDVSDHASVAKAAVQTLEMLGGAVRVLVNNAGVTDYSASILETSEEIWDRTVGVNLKGMFLVTKALLPSMLQVGEGAIVNMASVAAIVAGAGGPAYTSSKHGVVGLTKQLASDYGGRGIRVNAVAPGAVATSMTEGIIDNEDLEVVRVLRATPAGRYAEPEELASIAVFLASEEARFMHGSVLVADGGWSIR
ncbi:SDR family NAD(P)-dependent oxidoreductase [Sinomonas sp. G460-2]|uniref:SDR family NAD(P)-dependent oxidoreductase n=1 Tax=Sinomonas sp. G460-2 TaxID=3393464 RepID=UPI0039EF2DA4